MTNSEIRKHKAKQLRYKHSALESLGSAFLMDRLSEIEEACEDVRYFVDNDEDSLLNALDGDDEEVWEFKMAFADLAVDADRLRAAINDWRSIVFPEAEVWGLVMPKEDGLAVKKAIRLDDLVGLPLFCSGQGWEKDIPLWAKDKMDKLGWRVLSGFPIMLPSLRRSGSATY